MDIYIVDLKNMLVPIIKIISLNNLKQITSFAIFRAKEDKKIITKGKN